MAKRKDLEESEEENENDFDESSSAESSDEDVSSIEHSKVFSSITIDHKDTNMLDVEFEWFDPQPEYDFQGLKLLLRQLLDVDAHDFDLSALTDLILAQPLLGSTVKVEGNETDPYAFLTVLNLKEHRVCLAGKVFASV